MASKTLITNTTISSKLTSPGVNLAGGGGTWMATLDTTAHTGMQCDFTIQSAPSSAGPWSDVSDNSFQGGDGVSHTGWDQSHQVQEFTLFGVGPWWRIHITNMVGSMLVNSLVVTNTP